MIKVMQCCLLFALLLMQINGSLQEIPAYEYQYDAPVETGDGSRLVGARKVGKVENEAPFLVALNTFGQRPAAGCTGSLITNSWVLTAAHCTEYIRQRGPGVDVERSNDECVRETMRGSTYLSRPSNFELKCRYIQLPDGHGNIQRHLEIIPVNMKGRVWVGATDINVLENSDNFETSEIKKIIRHAYSYRGGGNYGDYGGHDISLVELETPIHGFQLACLPSPDFKSEDPNIQHSLAGFGRYYRTNRQGEFVCQTNKFGKAKYHYCREGAVCHQNKPPPQDSGCKTFLRKKGIPDDKDEAMVFDKRNRFSFCFRETNPENSTFGWCRTEGNYYNLNDPEMAHESWGYCSSDCYLDHTQEMSGVLRIKHNVKVLNDQMCNEFLEWSFQGNPVEVRPEILCVGETHDWKIGFFYSSPNRRGSYTEVPSSYKTKFFRFHYGAQHSFQGKYVASSGTCNGDSGGPLFRTETAGGKKTYVVEGVVSGGRGELAMCGGINNPVHYVKVSKFVIWIVRLLGPESRDLCWNNDFAGRLRTKTRGR